MSIWARLQAVEPLFRKVMMSVQDNTTTEDNLDKVLNPSELAKNVLKESKNQWVLAHILLKEEIL